MNVTPPRPLVTDTSSRTQTAAARSRVRERIKTDYLLMRHQLSTYEGRAFVWRRLELLGVFEDITGSDQTVRELIGKRRAGLRLMADAAEHPEYFNQMHVEGRARGEDARRSAEAAAEEARQAEEKAAAD